MDVSHHIGFRNSKAPELLNYLYNQKIKFDEGDIFSAVEIKESDPRWSTIESIITGCGIHSISNVIFSKEELAESEWLSVRSTWKNGYPQPESNFGYEEITYNKRLACDLCGAGLVQVNEFNIKKEPRWGKRNFFELNWVGDELFASERARDIFQRNQISGIEFWPIKRRSDSEIISNAFQLKISTILEKAMVLEKTLFQKKNRCQCCGREKYVLDGRNVYTFRNDAFRSVPDVVKSGEIFGDGHYASRVILIRQKVYQLIVDNGLDCGLEFQKVIME